MTSKNRRHITRCPMMEEDTPLVPWEAQGSSAKHGDGVSGNARREVRQGGAELGIARVYNQVSPWRNAVGRVQLLLSEGALQTGTENIRDPKVASPRQAARVRVGQLHRRLGREAPMRRTLLHRGPATWR